MNFWPLIYYSAATKFGDTQWKNSCFFSCFAGKCECCHIFEKIYWPVGGDRRL